MVGRRVENRRTSFMDVPSVKKEIRLRDPTFIESSTIQQGFFFPFLLKDFLVKQYCSKSTVFCVPLRKVKMIAASALLVTSRKKKHYIHPSFLFSVILLTFFFYTYTCNQVSCYIYIYLLSRNESFSVGYEQIRDMISSRCHFKET